MGPFSASLQHKTRVVRRRPPRSERGFSLLELAVVLALVAVLMVLAFNGRSMLTNRRLVGTARKIVSDIRMVQQRASTERTCYRIDFKPAPAPPNGESYDILRFNGTVTVAPPGGGNQCIGAWPMTPAFIEIAGDTVSRRMPKGIDLVSTTFSPADRLTFSPLGTPNAGMVTIRGLAGQERRIVVDSTGRVRIVP